MAWEIRGQKASGCRGNGLTKGPAAGGFVAEVWGRGAMRASRSEYSATFVNQVFPVRGRFSGRLPPLLLFTACFCGGWCGERGQVRVSRLTTAVAACRCGRFRCVLLHPTCFGVAGDAFVASRCLLGVCSDERIRANGSGVVCCLLLVCRGAVTGRWCLVLCGVCASLAFWWWVRG